jgi:hypothetical protein
MGKPSKGAREGLCGSGVDLKMDTTCKELSLEKVEVR